MPRYRKEEKRENIQRISVFSFIFPFLSVLYAETVFCFFSGLPLTVCKVLFSLSLGCLSAALGRLTPWRAVNCVLQTAYTGFTAALIAAQYLFFQTAGQYFSLFSGRPSASALIEAFSAVRDEIPFVLCIAVPVLLQLTVQNVVLFRRRSALSVLLHGNGMKVFGVMLLSAVLSLVSVFLAFGDDAGDASPRRQLEKEYLPQESVAAFGVVPQTVLDFKFNVLHIREEDVVHHYIVTENGERIELTEEELEKWNREG